MAVLEDVVCTAQHEVGRRWQMAEWGVAREHAATAISDAAVVAVSLRAASVSHGPADDPGGAAAPRGHVVVACVDGEWHALPARVVAVVLGLHGWRTTYLGESTPPSHLASYLHEVSPDAVALSCSLATGLPRARRTIEAAWAPTARAAAAALGRLPARRGPLPPLLHAGLDECAELVVRRAALVAASYEALE